MDQFSKDFGGLHSPDDFDLLSLGLVPGQEEQAETADRPAGIQYQSGIHHPCLRPFRSDSPLAQRKN